MDRTTTPPKGGDRSRDILTTRTSQLALLLYLLTWALSTVALTGDSEAIEGGLLDLSSSNLAERSLALNGQWYWQADQLLEPLKADNDSAALQHVPVNRFSGEQSANRATGTFWIDITPPANASNLGLYIRRSCSSAEIYLQPLGTVAQAPIATLGKTAAKQLSKPYAGGAIIPLNFQSTGTHRLLIQTSNQSYWTSGLCSELRIGDISALHRETSSQTLELAMLTAMLAMAGLYSLAIYAQRPEDKAPMWLTLACGSTAVFFFMYSGLLEAFIDSQSPWLFELRYRGLFVASSLVPAAMLMFYCRQFQGYISDRVLTGNMQITLLICLFYTITPAAMSWPLMWLTVVYWGVQFVAGLWVLLKAIRDKQPYATVMLLAALPVIVIVPQDLLFHDYVSAPPTLSLYALLFFIFVESQIAGRKFSTTFKLAERLSNNLREEVAMQTAELYEQNKQLERAQQALRKANTALKELSITDGLTRINNRMHFEQEFHKEWRRSSRQQTPVSVIMLDADHFKKLNDTAGHKVGDLCLQAIAEQLSRHFKRAGELVARYGGEEFVALLPETDQRKALAVAEGLRVAVEKLVITHKQESYKVTVSIGISTTIPSMHTSPDNLLEAADSALYEAKAGGRNQVAIIPLLGKQSEETPQRQLL